MVSFIQISIFAHELTSLLDIKVVMSKKDNTEQAILQAAETEFLDKGFALAKTTEIAKQAGVTHAMLHYYYRTKEKLFERVFQEKVDLMAHSLVATLDDGKPFLKQMEDLTGAHFDFIAENPKLPFFLLNEIHLNEKRREESAQTAALNEKELEVEKIRQQSGFYQTNEERLTGEIERYEKELEEVVQSLTDGVEEAARKEDNIKELQRTIEASRMAQSDAQEKLSSDVKRREELAGKQKNFFAEREELSARMSALDKEVYRLNAQKEKLEESMENQIDYMWNEYEITLRDAVLLRNETMTDLAVMKKQTAEVKDAIRGLGDVNVNAIEDYKSLMERYTFLKTQHDDLVEAEKTLERIIVELDEAMRRQFKEKFSEIGREFDKVFKELFGGGKGTLELMEDEDILEAGIRIIAQPPGKKLQNMMQLSGGEKALTAISLLFAIQNLKPSPFCLLDEIEAALDDSNVGRYAKYLHKLTAHTQFIVITHRRGTMEAADRLYGITMQEKGVSTLVSVNLIDKDLTD